MIIEELSIYIEKQLKQGETKEKITKILITSGWKEGDIEESFQFVISSVEQIKERKEEEN